jgi:hypothetical protein
MGLIKDYSVMSTKYTNILTIFDDLKSNYSGHNDIKTLSQNFFLKALAWSSKVMYNKTGFRNNFKGIYGTVIIYYFLVIIVIIVSMVLMVTRLFWLIWYLWRVVGR